MEKVRDAVSILDRREDVDFEYEGEMSPDLALNPDARALYPFSRLSEPANVLIMPAIHSASIATKLLAALGDATVIGPLMIGLEESVQIAPLNAAVSEIVTFAAMAAYNLSPKPAK
jgi:malate dehydrogenase (oxaloacetate-decarboxylating)(NADP+)